MTGNRSFYIGIICALYTPFLLAADCRCLPSQPCWPDQSAWNHLRKQLHGSLISPTPELAACEKDAASTACAKTLSALHNPFEIENNPGATQSQGWMNAWQTAASPYAVAAADADDVAAAVKFAHEHHLRVVIKGTGHDYLGRSSAPNSLLIWTHNMRTIQYQDKFIPAGCDSKTKSTPALTVGAGTRWLEAYDAAVNQHHRYVQGGGCTTVGAAGGFIQGGGFGSFSKKYGTGAAGVLQAEVVTADGKTLIANQCQNQDLFWAIRGGGASTYGVITKVTLRTHDLPTNFGLLVGTIKAKDDNAYKALIREIIQVYYSKLNNEHWGEQIRFSSDNTVTFGMTFVNLTIEQITTTFAPLVTWIGEHKKDYQMNLKPSIIPANKLWNLAYLKQAHPALFTLNQAQDALPNQFWWTTNSAEVSSYWYTYQSWWLPIQLFDAQHAAQLATAIYDASKLSAVNLHFNKGQAGASAEAIQATKATSTNPEVMTAAALVIMAARTNTNYLGVKGKEPDMTKAKVAKENISRAMQYFMMLAPNAGTYVNEADYFMPQWQQVFWGTNYPKLLAVKKKYDPDGVFYCHHCVGSESWDDNGMCPI